jgi:hypothetical protein
VPGLTGHDRFASTTKRRQIALFTGVPKPEALHVTNMAG